MVYTDYKVHIDFPKLYIIIIIYKPVKAFIKNDKY